MINHLNSLCYALFKIEHDFESPGIYSLIYFELFCIYLYCLTRILNTATTNECQSHFTIWHDIILAFRPLCFT